jgi:hypothetical protein
MPDAARNAFDVIGLIGGSVAILASLTAYRLAARAAHAAKRAEQWAQLCTEALARLAGPLKED